MILVELKWTIPRGCSVGYRIGDAAANQRPNSRVSSRRAPDLHGGAGMTLAHVECKAQFSVDDAGAISGVAWPFGSPDRSGDMIAPGAFKGAAPPLPMLFGHDPLDVVGAWEGVTVTRDGLSVAGRLLVDDVARAREVWSMVKSRAVRGLSIGISIKEATRRPGGGRMITAVDLVEISLVSIPMHPGARVTGTKSAADAVALANAIHRAAAALRTR